MYLDINSVRIFYEQSGEGSPVILLHGNGGSHKTFEKLLPKLSAHHTVYALDSRCHGNSQKDCPISYETMADDVYAFIKELRLEKPMLYGFSDGGIVGLLLAAKHPDLLSRLAVSGVNISPHGLKTGNLFSYALAYAVGRDKKLKMMLREPNIPTSALQAVQIPVLLLAGSKDLIKRGHLKLIANNMPHCSLNILEGETHGSYVHNADKLYPLLEGFFSEP